MSNEAVCAVWKSHMMMLDSFVVIRPWTYRCMCFVFNNVFSLHFNLVRRLEEENKQQTNIFTVCSVLPCLAIPLYNTSVNRNFCWRNWVRQVCDVSKIFFFFPFPTGLSRRTKEGERIEIGEAFKRGACA